MGVNAEQTLAIFYIVVTHTYMYAWLGITMTFKVISSQNLETIKE